MGSLAGLKVVELTGLGPAPFCGALLGDLGADVLRIDRLDAVELGIEFPQPHDLRSRDKRSLALDIEKPEGFAVLRGLIAGADVLIEGFRPGVADWALDRKNAGRKIHVRSMGAQPVGDKKDTLGDRQRLNARNCDCGMLGRFLTGPISLLPQFWRRH